MNEDKMKKLLSAALALTMLSTPALAGQDDHQDYDDYRSSYGRGDDGYHPVRYDRDGRYGRYDRRERRGYGRDYCRRDSNTGGTVLGAVAGGLLGNTVAKRGDKTLGTVVGGVLGGVIGHEVDDQNRCR